ncbi:uncharacterized protein LOC144452218 [Glandiceps talaboti]
MASTIAMIESRKQIFILVIVCLLNIASAGNTYNGWDVTNRAYRDSGSAQVFVDNRLVFPDNGEVTKWQIYSRGFGVVYLQVWRPHSQDDCTVELVGETRVDVDALGFKSVDLNSEERIRVKPGDLIGWRTPGTGVITWDADLSSDEQHFCFKWNIETNIGEVYDLTDEIGWGPDRVYSVRADYTVLTSDADNQEIHSSGFDVENRDYIDSGSATTFVDERLSFGDNGEVIGWQIYTRGQGTVYLQVWRPQHQENCSSIELVGETEVYVEDTTPRFMTIDLDLEERIRVKPGDLIGWRTPGTGVITWDSNLSSGKQHHCFKWIGETNIGEVYDLTDPITWGPDRIYSVKALHTILTPDDDNQEIHYDGFDVENRDYIDSGSAITLVDERLVFEDNGEVIGWQIYTRGQGTVYLQVWRPQHQEMCSSIELVGETEVYVEDSTPQFMSIDLDLEERIRVKPGDLIGWRTPGTGVITWDSDLSSGKQHHCFKWIGETNIGEVYDLTDPITWGPDRIYSVKALHTILKVEDDDQDFNYKGFDVENRDYIDSGSAITLVDKRLLFEDNADITGWEIYTRGQGTVYLQVWRPHTNEIVECNMELVGETEVYVENNMGLVSIDLDLEKRIRVKPGDLIGWCTPGTGVITWDSDLSSDEQHHCFKWLGETNIGEVYDLTDPITWGPDRIYSVRAVYTVLKVEDDDLETHSKGFDVRSRNYIDSGSAQTFVDKRLYFGDSGKIIGWEIYTRGQGTVYLQVWRPQSQKQVDKCSLELIGETVVNVGDTPGLISIDLNSEERIRVKPGDLIGWRTPGTGVITWDADLSSDEQHFCFKWNIETNIGEVYDLTDEIGWGPDRVYSVKAVYTVDKKGSESEERNSSLVEDP